MKTKPLICTVFISLFVLIAQAQQKLNYIPLTDADTTLHPIETAFNNKLNDVQIVGLGEATHGDKTTFAFNFNMVKYLVSERGFRTLITEAPNIAIMPFNKFLLNDSAYTGSQVDTVVCKNLGIGPDRDRQFTALIKWLKDYNLTHKSQKVSITGMSVDIVPYDILLNNEIKPYDPVSAAAIAQKWKTPGYQKMDKTNDLFNWQDNHKALIAQLPDSVKNRINTDFYNTKTALELYLDVSIIRETKNELIVADNEGKPRSLDTGNFFRKLHANPDYHRSDSLNRFAQIFKKRDSLMAVFTLNLAGNNKAIVWAHNYHVSKPGLRTMGDFLNKALRDKYFTLITDYSKGGEINRFAPTRDIRKTPDAMAGHVIVKELKKKYDMDEGIVFSTEFTRLGYTNIGVHGAGIEGMIAISNTLVKSFDALAVLGAIQPRDLYQ